MPEPAFRLENIIILRERQRDTAAGSYKEALAAKSKLETQIESLQQEYAAQLPLQANYSAGQVNTQRLIESQRFQLHLLQQVANLRAQLELIVAECEKRRLNLVLKEQALSSLEKLRVKQQALWTAMEISREQEMLDQWASFKHWKETRSS
jgi:flagellar export protein FliJ